MSTWKEMKEAGWELVRTDEKKRKVFKTPVRKGKRRTIQKKRDLDEQDQKYAKILYPGKDEVDLILQEEMALQVGQEGEVQVGQEGEVDLGQEGEVDLGQEGEVDLGQEGEVTLGQEGEVDLGQEGELDLGQEGEVDLGQEGEVDLGQEGELDPGQESPETDHGMALTAVARKVEEMVKNFESATINIDESLEYLEIALMTKEHPFHETFESNGNFFVKAIDFGLTNSRALLYTIARSMFTLEPLACMDAHKVIKLAFIFANIVCSRSPKILTGFKKKVSVFAQACGISNDGLNVLFRWPWEEDLSIAEKLRDLVSPGPGAQPRMMVPR
jgi:hypothetical protein